MTQCGLHIVAKNLVAINSNHSLTSIALRKALFVSPFDHPNTMITKTYILFLLLLFSTMTSFSQGGNECLTVSIKGYMIDAGGKKLFQQCEDSTTNFLKSIDNTSFSIWCNQIQDNYCESVDSLGETLEVNVRFQNDSTINKMRISYFYCTIKTTVCFIGRDTNDIVLYKKPQFEILHKDKSYFLDHFWVREFLREIIPQKDNDLRKMYNYYYNKGYSVPEWLDKEMENRSKMKDD